METIYIRSISNQVLRNKLASSCCACENAKTSLTSTDPDHVRTWHADISIVERPGSAREVHIDDPFAISEYKTCFERYLTYSEENDLHRDTIQAANVKDEIDRLGAKIKGYAELLLEALNLDVGSETTCCLIYIIASDDSETPVDDIHCLAWELLESVCPPNQPNCKIRVTRITEDYRSENGLESPVSRAIQPAPTRLTRRRARFRVLLVIARNLVRLNPRDADPHLAQFPLMNIQKRLGGQLLLEVVRPGSVEELKVHLMTRRGQGVRFHLVHFDLHGSISSRGCVFLHLLCLAMTGSLITSVDSGHFFD
jgi:hypothetical protein